LKTKKVSSQRRQDAKGLSLCAFASLRANKKSREACLREAGRQGHNFFCASAKTKESYHAKSPRRKGVYFFVSSLLCAFARKNSPISLRELYLY
jgi:hypothetical protein